MRLRSRRPAISEVIGTVMVAAMTVIAGAAIFGYVNGQAGVASQAYGQSVGNSIQYLEEKFAVVDMSWCTPSPCTSVTLWIYNTGKIQLTLLQIRFYDSAGTINLLYNYSLISGSNTNRIHDLRSTSPGKCGMSGTSYESPPLVGTSSFAAAISTTATIQLTIPPTSSGCPSYGQTLALQSSPDTYFVAATGANGNAVTYSQVKTS